MNESKRPERARARPSDWLRLALPIVIVVGLVIAAWHFGYFQLKNPRHLARAADKVQGVAWLGPMFVAIYSALAALAAPVSPLAYAGGAVFDVVRGTIYVWIGSMIGGTAGYWLARGIWADSAKRLLGRYENKLQTLREGSAFLTTLRVQLLPIVPFGVFNYAAGASRLSFGPYLMGTAIGVLPGSVAAVYVGDRVAAGFAGGDKRAFLVAVAVAAALVLVSFIPTIVSKLRDRR